MANISAIKLPDNTTYNIKAGAIPYGEVDSTSTSTAYTATVPGINELKNGTIMLLRNGTVTSASGFKININGLGAKPVYNNLATGNTHTPTNPTRDTTIFNINYTMLFIYDEELVSGGAWICYRGYDANTNTIGYQLRGNNGTRPASDKGYRYRLWLSSLDNQNWVPINTSTATDAATSRSLNSRVIDPFGEIVYYAYNGTTNAAANLTATNIWQQYTLTIGYSYVKSLTAWDPVYLKCEPKTTGGAVMKDIVQALPSTADGFIYIYLGIAYSATAMELRFYHPVYYHDGTGIRAWTGYTETDPIFTASPAHGITTNDITNWNNKSDFSGSYNDLTDKPTIPVLPSNIVNTVTTTAGAHTAITNATGNVSFKVPTKTSHLTNDSGFLTSYTETDPIFTASAAHGITSTDITNWNNKLDSYTETDPTVHAWAKAETKPSYTFSEIGSKPTTISGYGITDAYTKTQVDGLVAGVLHYKGTKASVANLPTSDNTTGDVWHITADGSEYAWDGSVWQELGTAIDLSEYAIKATTLAGYGISDAKIENGTITLGSNSITPLTTETDPVFTASPAYGITANDIANWNAKVSDTKTWGDVVAPSGRADTSDSRYIPQFSSTSSSSTTTATFTVTRVEPFRLGVPKWDLNNYLYAATPSANDNSTKVATTAFVQSAIPTIPDNISDLTNDQIYDLGTITPDNNGSFALTTQQVNDIVAMWNRGFCAVKCTVDGADYYAFKERIITFNDIDFYGFVNTNVYVEGSFAVESGNVMVGISQTYGIGMFGRVRDVTSEDVSTAVCTATSSKQDTLVSGSNIKTINGNSILGSGNLSTSEIFIATYNSTSYSDILTAYNNGKIIFCKDGPAYIPLTNGELISDQTNGKFYFRFLNSLNAAKQYYVNSSGWSSGSFLLVTTDRTINGKNLGRDITLTASDVDALPSSTDVTKWNNVVLNKSTVSETGRDTVSIPLLVTESSTTAFLMNATFYPNGGAIPRYDANAYLNSTTPAAGDNSTKVATTAFVQSAIPTVPTNVSAFTNDAGYITSYTDEQLKWVSLRETATFYPLTSTSAEATSTANTPHAIIFEQYYNTAGGYRRLRLGNSTAYTSTAGAYGTIRLYGTGATYYGDLNPGTVGANSLTANRTWTLPDATGTIALTADIPTVPAWAKASSKPSYGADEISFDNTQQTQYLGNATNVNTALTSLDYALDNAEHDINYISSDYFSKSGGTIKGDVTLYVASGNSPALIFQRGTLTDNYNDWKIYDKSGFLYFAQRGSGASAFGDMGYIDTGGVLRGFTIPWGSVTGKPTFATVATSGSYNDLSDKPTIPDGLPSVTTADNGKVLRVVNGAWSAVALPSASGVNF